MPGTSMGLDSYDTGQLEYENQAYLLDVFSDTSMVENVGGLGSSYSSYSSFDRSFPSSSSKPNSGKELAIMMATNDSLQSQARNTRKTKKPKDWSDFTHPDAVLDNGGYHEDVNEYHAGPIVKKASAASHKRKKVDTDSGGSYIIDDRSGGSSDDHIVSGGSTTSSRNTVMAAKERRRERNKVLARKTRVKKKAELETLRDQVCLLRAENDRLKSIVKSRLPSSVGAHLLVECDIQLPDNVAVAVQELVAKAEVNHGHLFETLKSAQRSFCISNAQAADQPIVYASPGFVELTGYSIAEILGRNCRFLQGPGTDKAEVARLKQGIMSRYEVSATLMNYRKDGSQFWNFIQVAPMVDQNGNTALIIGVQCEVANPPRSDGHPELAQNSFNGSTTISHQVSNSNSSGSDDGRSACLHGSDDGFGGANGSDDGMFNGPDDFDKNFEKLVGNEQECASGI